MILMSKVKITKEQADAMEREVVSTENEEVIRCHLKGWVFDENQCLNELTLDELVRALYIGYEVGPEFKVGDWVTYNYWGLVGKVVCTSGGISLDNRQNSKLNPNDFNHATPEEIAKEKQRRWWAKHDRDVWEIRQGDVLMAIRRHIFEVTADPKSHEFGVYTGNDEFDFNIEECQDENWKVICFRDDRKDVQA